MLGTTRPISKRLTSNSDEEYARAQELPAVIADGMISTNWISGMLVEQFGMDYLERGELRTRFRRPVLLGAGLALGAHRLSGEVGEPILVALYSIPKVTLYPVVLLFFGIGMPAKSRSVPSTEPVPSRSSP